MATHTKIVCIGSGRILSVKDTDTCNFTIINAKVYQDHQWAIKIRGQSKDRKIIIHCKKHVTDPHPNCLKVFPLKDGFIILRWHHQSPQASYRNYKFQKFLEDHCLTGASCQDPNGVFEYEVGYEPDHFYGQVISNGEVELSGYNPRFSATVTNATWTIWEHGYKRTLFSVENMFNLILPTPERCREKHHLFFNGRRDHEVHSSHYRCCHSLQELIELYSFLDLWPMRTISEYELPVDQPIELWLHDKREAKSSSNILQAHMYCTGNYYGCLQLKIAN